MTHVVPGAPGALIGATTQKSDDDAWADDVAAVFGDAALDPILAAALRESVGAVDDALASALSDVSSRRCVVVDAAKPTEATVAAGDVASRAELKTGRAARKRRVSV